MLRCQLICKSGSRLRSTVAQTHEPLNANPSSKHEMGWKIGLDVCFCAMLHRLVPFHWVQNSSFTGKRNVHCAEFNTSLNPVVVHKVTHIATTCGLPMQSVLVWVQEFSDTPAHAIVVEHEETSNGFLVGQEFLHCFMDQEFTSKSSPKIHASLWLSKQMWMSNHPKLSVSSLPSFKQQ